MKKLFSLLTSCAVLSASVFAEGKDWNVEIQAKMKAIEIQDFTDERDTNSFSKDMFDDDTKISFTFENDSLEAGLEITPVFFWADDTFKSGTTPDPLKAFTALYAGVKFGEVGKLRGGIFEEHSKDRIENFWIESWLDINKIGFLSTEFEISEETDLINGQALLDLYAGPVTIQISPVASTFKGDDRDFGIQGRIILDFKPVTLAFNEQLKSISKDSEDRMENLFSAYARLNVIDGLPIFAGFALKTNSEDSDKNISDIDIRLEKDFEKAAFTLHNNITFLKNHKVLYNALGLEAPASEVLAIGTEIENYVDMGEDNNSGKFRICPYLKYSPAEEVCLKGGIEYVSNWTSDSTKMNFAIPLKIQVAF